MSALSSPVGATPAPAPAADGRAMSSLLAASLALLLLYLAWGLVDGRTVNGDPVWLKPAKFAVSFVVTFATLVWVQRQLSAAWRAGWLLRVAGWSMAAAFAFEMAYMTYMAARGESSHFNLSSAFTIQMYRLMGLGAVTLLVGIAIHGVAVLRDGEARMSPGLKLATGLGLMATLVLTLPTAGYLSSTGSHFVGVLPADPRSVPLLGWSLSVGDLRPAHFLALHAMQALPLYALLRERGGRRIGRAEVVGMALVWSALTLAVFVQALAGHPLVRL